MSALNIVHITPKDKPDYCIVSVLGRPDLCWYPVSPFIAAMYARYLRHRHAWIR